MTYLRVFEQDEHGRIPIIGCMVFIILTFIPIELMNIFACRPLQKSWDLEIDEAGCLDSDGLFYSTAAINIVTYIWIFASVLPRVLSLRLPRGQKIALVAVVASGGLVIIACMLRLIRVSVVLAHIYEDFSWNSYDIFIWSTLEANMAIFCASAPLIRPLLRKFFPKLGLVETSNSEVPMKTPKRDSDLHSQTEKTETHASSMAEVSLRGFLEPLSAAAQQQQLPLHQEQQLMQGLKRLEEGQKNSV